MKIFRQYVGILIAGILFFFLIKPLVQTHTHLKDITFQIQWEWLFISFGVILFYWSAYLYPFAKLLRGITEKNVPFRTVWTIFHLANITRYLPGRIWGIVRLLSLSQRFGLRKTAVGISLTLHVSIETAFSGLIAVSLLFSKQMQDTVIDSLERMSRKPVGLFMLSVIGIMAGILFLILTLSAYARGALNSLWRTGTHLFQKPFRYQWLHIIIGHILLRGCQGLAFFSLSEV